MGSILLQLESLSRQLDQSIRLAGPTERLFLHTAKSLVHHCITSEWRIFQHSRYVTDTMRACIKNEIVAQHSWLQRLDDNSSNQADHTVRDAQEALRGAEGLAILLQVPPLESELDPWAICTRPRRASDDKSIDAGEADSDYSSEIENTSSSTEEETSPAQTKYWYF